MALIPGRHLPNILSLLRLLMVWPVAYLILSGQAMAALLLFVLAGASDGLDGYLAKRYGWVSRLGSYLDPLADKTLLVTVCLVFVYAGWLPVWLVAMIIARDLIILLGALAYLWLIGGLKMEPLWSSKANTFLQILLCLMVLSGQAFNEIWIAGVVQWLVLMVLATVVYSGVEYVYRWMRMARNERRRLQGSRSYE